MIARITLSLILVVALNANTVFAQNTFTWSVNNNIGAWNSPANWGGLGTPGAGDTAEFSDFTIIIGSQPVAAAEIDLSSPFPPTQVARNINFLFGNSTTAFTIGTSVQTLNLDGGTTSSISREGSANSTFAASVNLLGSSRSLSITNSDATSNRSLNFSSSLNIGTNALTVNGIGKTDISTLSGSGATSSATFTGSGDSTLSSISGISTINVQGGTRDVGIINGASVLNLSGGSLTLNNLNTTGTNTTSINVTGGNHTITSVNRAAVNLSGTGSIASNITVSNNSSLGGAGVIGGNVVVNSGSILSGTSTINGNVSIQTGATHSPGNSPGTQTIAGNLTYDAGSTFVWELDGNSTSNGSFDQILLTDPASSLLVNGSMETRLVFTNADFSDDFWKSNRTWTVFTGLTNSAAVNNMQIAFVPLAPKPNGDFKWKQSGSNLNLTFSAVPEPGTLALLGLAAGLAGFAKRRKLKALVART